MKYNDPSKKPSSTITSAMISGEDPSRLNQSGKGGNVVAQGSSAASTTENQSQPANTGHRNADTASKSIEHMDIDKSGNIGSSRPFESQNTQRINSQSELRRFQVYNSHNQGVRNRSGTSFVRRNWVPNRKFPESSDHQYYNSQYQDQYPDLHQNPYNGHMNNRPQSRAPSLDRQDMSGRSPMIKESFHCKRRINKHIHCLKETPLFLFLGST